jgi:hypothetical protein
MPNGVRGTPPILQNDFIVEYAQPVSGRGGICEFKLAAANVNSDSFCTTFSRKPNKMFQNQNKLTRAQIEFLESHYQLTAQH